MWILKQRFLLATSASILLLLAGWIWWSTSKQSLSPASRTGDSVRPVRQTRSNPLPIASAGSASAEVVEDKASHADDTKPVSREEILTEIEEASVTYDAAALPRIQRFLLHPDPEVRESARNGMIVLGDAQAGPLLREASRHVTDPREAAVLLEAADYVELPSATPRLRKRSPVQPR